MSDLADQVNMDPRVLRARIAVLLPLAVDAQDLLDLAKTTDDLIEHAEVHPGVKEAKRSIIGTAWNAADYLQDCEIEAQTSCDDPPQLYGHPNDPNHDPHGRLDRHARQVETAIKSVAPQFRRDMQALLRAVDAVLARPLVPSAPDGAWADAEMAA